MSNASSTNEILVSFVCPAVGTFLCFVMWYDKTATATADHNPSLHHRYIMMQCYGCRLSPCTAILKARQESRLGSLNPLPFSLTIMNCIGWSAYGLMRRDFFIYFANVSGEDVLVPHAMMLFIVTLTGCVTLYYRSRSMFCHRWLSYTPSP